MPTSMLGISYLKILQGQETARGFTWFYERLQLLGLLDKKSEEILATSFCMFSPLIFVMVLAEGGLFFLFSSLLGLGVRKMMDTLSVLDT